MKLKLLPFLLVLSSSITLSATAKADISINGTIYKSNSNNITITNGKVIVDGKPIDSLSNSLEIRFIGDVGNIKSDASVYTKGNVMGNIQAGGSVNAHDVGSYVNAGGSIHANNIQGHARAGGTINCN